MLVVSQIVYAPKFIALTDACLAWIENSTTTTPLTPEANELNTTSIYISNILNFGRILAFIGAVYIVIRLIAKNLKNKHLNPKHLTIFEIRE